jgi:16S rRNA (cytosine1402-N4)-methyltransferase
MVSEVLEAMQPRASGIYCDATVGTAGHAMAILEASAPSGRVVGVDRDQDALEVARQRLGDVDPDRWMLLHLSFSELGRALDESGQEGFDGILADLGLSSLQIDEPARGFSFRARGPLDMRMDRTRPGTVLDLLRSTSARELQRILSDLGEERMASRVARRLHRSAREGRIRDTLDLAGEVRAAMGRSRAGRVDAATRTFQALRMAVNREQDELDALLRGVERFLRPGGTFVCLSYHSLEDRKVKHAFRDARKAGQGEVLTPKPLVPGSREIRSNRRARSAKLRAFRRRAS